MNLEGWINIADLELQRLDNIGPNALMGLCTAYGMPTMNNDMHPCFEYIRSTTEKGIRIEWKQIAP